MADNNRCDNPITCPGGNCVGCLDGVPWCRDPRCQPNCHPEVCTIPEGHDFNGNLVIFIVLMCLSAILFLLFIAYGPNMARVHSDDKLAGEVMPSDGP